MVQVKTKTKVDTAQLVPKELASLETEFKALVDSIGAEIEGKLLQAKKLVREACKLSTEHGIPFYSPVSILGENFVPPSFKEKFNALNKRRPSKTCYAFIKRCRMKMPMLPDIALPWI